MYTIQLSKKERKTLKQLLQKEKRIRVYRRLQALEMADAKYSYQDIASSIGVCVDTVTDWMKLYQESQLVGLCDLRFTGKRQSPFDQHAEQITQDITDNTIATIAELQEWIKQKYSLHMEQSWLFRCCKKNSIYLTKKLV